METTYYKPHPLLKKYIYKYWSWECGKNMAMPKVLPGVVTEVLFHYKVPFHFVHSKTAVSYGAKQSCIVGLRDSSYDLLTEEETGFIAVRFREGAFNNFCGTPQKEITGQFPSPFDLWGTKGGELEEKVMAAPTNPERIKIIESYLFDFLAMFSHNDKRMDYIVKQVSNNANLRCLSNELGLSYRHFNRLFTGYTGLTPKGFQKISRFDGILRNLTLSKNRIYLNEVLNAGYYDQSHFIKDFKNFVNETPASFLTEKHFMSHFYNTGIIN